MQEFLCIHSAVTNTMSIQDSKTKANLAPRILKAKCMRVGAELFREVENKCCPGIACMGPEWQTLHCDGLGLTAQLQLQQGSIN